MVYFSFSPHLHPNFTTGQTSIHFPQCTHPSPITATPSSITITSFGHWPTQTPHPCHLRARRMDNSTLCINLRAFFSVSLRAVLSIQNRNRTIIAAWNCSSLSSRLSYRQIQIYWIPTIKLVVNFKYRQIQL